MLNADFVSLLLKAHCNLDVPIILIIMRDFFSFRTKLFSLGKLDKHIDTEGQYNPSSVY